MKHTIRSLGNALSGFRHALMNETNLRRFVLAQIVIILAALWLPLDPLSIILILIFAAFFIVVELFNTSIEHLSDTVNDLRTNGHAHEFHAGIKMTKDIAAAASLIAFVVDCCVLLLIFLPPVIFLLANRPPV